jgi:uncharacterized membrane protein
MSVAECLIALQTRGGLGDSGQSPGGNSLHGWYIVIAILGLVLALVVFMFIRTSMGRASKR